MKTATDTSSPALVAHSTRATGSAPRFYWEQCYEMARDEVHWALRDTESTKEGKVTCAYMVLLSNYPTALDGKPVSEQFMPALIVELLNAHFATPNVPHEPLGRRKQD